MYCVFNATTSYQADTGNPLGWPLDDHYGYFCDKRDQNLYMLSNGFLNVLAMVGLYLLTVLYVGPRLMHNRKPLEIKNVIRVYNGAMVLANVYLVKRALGMVDNGRSFFNCKGVEMDFSRVEELANLTELFLLSRVMDFLDTVWFVLRKKQSHVSFLHVFHHSYVPTVAYAATRWIPVVPNTMSFPFVNSIIHILMYAYYLLSTFPSLRPYLWWKRYLTSLQISQFIGILIYNVYGFFYFNKVCGKPQTSALCSSLISAAIFLALFRSFYKKAYSSPPPTTTPPPTTASKALEDNEKQQRHETIESSPNDEHNNKPHQSSSLSKRVTTNPTKTTTTTELLCNTDNDHQRTTNHQQHSKKAE